MSDEIIERSFPVSTSASLRLGNIRGTVKIQPGDDHLIKVTAVKHAGSGSTQDTLIEMNQDEDERVIIRTSYSSDVFKRILISGRPCKVDYDVQVPHACTLHISGVSSSTRVQGVSGEIELESVSGSLTLEEVSGRIEISSVSGDVYGEVLAGPGLRISTVSGDVDVRQADFPRIEGKTVSGDLRIETPLGEGPYSFNTVSGDVVLVVPSPIRCSVKVKGISGGFKSALPLTIEQRKSGTHYAEVLGGGVPVTLRTVSGDLHLKSTAGDESTVPAGLHSQSSRGEILDKIERGEISVDEGVLALKS